MTNELEKIREELKKFSESQLELLAVAEQMHFDRIFPDHWSRAFVYAELTGNYNSLIKSLENAKRLIEGFLAIFEGLKNAEESLK